MGLENLIERNIYVRTALGKEGKPFRVYKLELWNMMQIPGGKN